LGEIMAVTLNKGQLLTKDDLNVYILDADTGQYFSPFSISYTIYKINKNFNNCCEEAIYETIDSTPIPFGIGKFFAPWKMPSDITIGSYKIKWNVKKYADYPIVEENEEFEIVVSVDKMNQSCCLGQFGSSDIMGSQFSGGCAEAY
jgi:hypothetical protein